MAPRRWTDLSAITARFATTAIALSTVWSMTAQAVPLVGVVGNDLIGFDSATPGVVTTRLTTSGFGTKIVRGIDFRPSTGQLFAIAQDNFSQPVGLYTVNTVTGIATNVGTINNSSSVDFDIAFNPVVDRIRVVNADNTNLRVNPSNAATTIDTPLAYAAGDANAGVDPTLTAAAYTNQSPGAQTATVLYGIDAATNALVTINPPNNGTLNTVGALGVNLFNFGVGPGLGFDIDGVSGTAFASLTTATGGNNLYTINLTTGAATLIGAFGQDTVRDIAVGSLGLGTGDGTGSGVAVPEPASLAILGFGLTALLARRRRTV